MEDTNRRQDCIKVVWEVLPDEDKHVFREFGQEDIDPAPFYSDRLLTSDNFPVLPHPVLDKANDCLDRVWNQTTIEIRAEVVTGDPTDIQEIKKAFDLNDNHKGYTCPFNLNICQEGWCQGCSIYLNGPAS